MCKVYSIMHVDNIIPRTFLVFMLVELKIKYWNCMNGLGYIYNVINNLLPKKCKVINLNILNFQNTF